MPWNTTSVRLGTLGGLLLLCLLGTGCQPPADERQPAANPAEVQRLRGDEATAEMDAEAELDYEEDQP